MILGGRYEILQILGEGGMGAVYKAQDRELGRTVALKVIRPELASNPDILQRFKQELLLVIAGRIFAQTDTLYAVDIARWRVPARRGVKERPFYDTEFTALPMAA